MFSIDLFIFLQWPFIRMIGSRISFQHFQGRKREKLCSASCLHLSCPLSSIWKLNMNVPTGESWILLLNLHLMCFTQNLRHSSYLYELSSKLPSILPYFRFIALFFWFTEVWTRCNYTYQDHLLYSVIIEFLWHNSSFARPYFNNHDSGWFIFLFIGPFALNFRFARIV